ncbi:hypothetical protein [Staphylococcus equorum]|uniref:hypothetical protein n=1 Tax=Staphylococcus equorum TaxID=246432 RepID=UPI000806360A|nr:hypothetical protein [Staphylococcus equorum]ANQ65702.1 hypothetical protein AVJ22_13640 [Staphylococcus equorum]MDK9856107.1 hypothetical protein [Staphylococcus equorum]MDK9870125.1 hypothetical protein [Staphylococcus equorum]MDN5638713.1 hypothetical protein [Staphylococcus equorum]OEK76498.1 hypothetical protein AST05_07895 [Staphylococcus equorum]
MTEENAKKEKVKKLAVVGNILGCLTIVLFILRFPLESRYGGSILENTAFVTALLTFISYLIRNLILKKIIGSIASLALVIFIIIILFT